MTFLIKNTLQRTAFLGITLCLTFASALSAQEAPVQVYILSGQSNMVGIGKVDGGGSSWRKVVSEPVVSVYPGPYNSDADYDEMQPTQSLALERFSTNDAYPGKGTHVLRGYITVEETGIYEFRPGWDQSTQNITYINGKEVHRKEPGQNEAIRHPIKLVGGEKTPFKTVYLSKNGSSTGYFSRLDVPGTLKVLVQEGKFQYLVDDEGQFLPRDDVWYKGVVTAPADKWLDVGCGADSNSIGPELGFGHQVGDHHEAPVLLIKASQGNRSLGWDFLPPSSERFEYIDDNGKTLIFAGYKDPKSRWEKGTEPEKGGWYAGKQYDDCFNAAKDVLANFDKEFPHWAGRGYEIAGFGWWQGHKDGGEDGSGKPTVHAMRYEQNLARLIQVLRQEFEAPNAPFVISTCGFAGGKNWEPGSSADTIFEAQMAVSDPAKHPELGGNIMTVDARPFYRPPEVSPKNQSFHYNQNAETYMMVGEAMGRAMVRLKE